MRNLKLNTEKLVEYFQKLVDVANNCYNDYCEEEGDYNFMVTLKNVSNLITFDEQFMKLQDSADSDNKVYLDELYNTINKSLKGILELEEK